MFNRSVNKVILVGNLGKDAEVRFLPNGDAVCNFSIATTESWKNKQTGEYENSTEWHNCTVFRKFGEMCGQYLKKGAKVYLEGKLKTRKWQDQTTGQDKYATDVIVSELQMMDSKDSNQGQQQPMQQQAPMQQPQQQTQQAPQTVPQQQAPQPQHQPTANNNPNQAAPQYAQPQGIDQYTPF